MENKNCIKVVSVLFCILLFLCVIYFIYLNFNLEDKLELKKLYEKEKLNKDDIIQNYKLNFSNKDFLPFVSEMIKQRYIVLDEKNFRLSIGKNKKELENGYYDIMFCIEDNTLEVYVNKLFKEENFVKNSVLDNDYLNEIINLSEYKEDKTYLENRIIDVEKKIKEEQELEQYNFTFEDIMLKRDIESIKCFINPFYELNFQAKWDKLSVSEKQELITSYIDSIEVIKNDKDIKIKHITFRKTFIEEYANIFNSGGINSNQEIKANDMPINIEVSAPMTREEITIKLSD